MIRSIKTFLTWGLNMNKTWLIVGLIIAIVLGVLIFGNIFADGRQALDKRRVQKLEPKKKGIELYATDETVDLKRELAGS